MAAECPIACSLFCNVFLIPMPASSMSEIISTVAAAAAALLPAAGVGRGSHIRACEGWAGKNETCGRCRLSLIPILYRRCTSIPTTSHSITSASRVTMEPGPSGSVGMPPSLHLSDQARLAVLCSDIRPVHSTFFLKQARAVDGACGGNVGVRHQVWRAWQPRQGDLY